MANKVHVDVSGVVKAQFIAEGKRLTEEKGYEYNQDLNAYVALNVLKGAGVDFSNAKLADVLGILKRAGNASANRQALEAESGSAKSAKAEEIAEELMA